MNVFFLLGISESRNLGIGESWDPGILGILESRVAVVMTPHQQIHSLSHVDSLLRGVAKRASGANLVILKSAHRVLILLPLPSVVARRAEVKVSGGSGADHGLNLLDQTVRDNLLDPTGLAHRRLLARKMVRAIITALVIVPMDEMDQSAMRH